MNGENNEQDQPFVGEQDGTQHEASHVAAPTQISTQTKPLVMPDNDPGHTMRLEGVKPTYNPNAGYFLNVALRRSPNVPLNTFMEFIDNAVPVKVFRSNKITYSSFFPVAATTEIYTGLFAYEGDFSSGSARCTGQGSAAYLLRQAIIEFWVGFEKRRILTEKILKGEAKKEELDSLADTIEHFNLAGVWRANNSFGAFTPEAPQQNQRQFTPQTKPQTPGPNMSLLTRGIRVSLYNGEVRTLIGEGIFAARINSSASRGTTSAFTI